MIMLRIASLIFALLVSWSACAQVPLTGAGKGAPGGVIPFGITKTDNQVDATGQTTYNFTLSVGADSPSRMIVVVDVSRNAGVVSNATGASIGGSAATPVKQGLNSVSGTSTANIWQRAVPSGATVSFSVTYPSAMLRCGVAAFVVLGSNGSTPSGAQVDTQNWASGAALNSNLTVPTGGGMVIVNNNANSLTVTPTNYTEDFDGVVGSTMNYEGGHDVSHSGATTYTVTWSSSSLNNGLLTSAAWGP